MKLEQISPCSSNSSLARVYTIVLWNLFGLNMIAQNLHLFSALHSEIFWVTLDFGAKSIFSTLLCQARPSDKSSSEALPRACLLSSQLKAHLTEKARRAVWSMCYRPAMASLASPRLAPQGNFASTEYRKEMARRVVEQANRNEMVANLREARASLLSDKHYEYMP